MSKSNISAADLKFWIDHNLNVILRGPKGVGKTAKVMEAFKQAGLRVQYFSSGTMDPWIDFVGVPEKVMDAKTGVAYLELVRPKAFANNEVDVIVLDEYNRSTPKTRNATLELLQFKSINGHKFPNLRMVWAMVNPDDDTDEHYDVEKLDPAQLDRFHVIVDVPNEVDIAYLSGKFGTQAYEAADWWKNLDEKVKREVSPRRLDYAMEMFTRQGNLSWVLPPGSNPNALKKALEEGSIPNKLQAFYKAQDKKGGQKWIRLENIFDAARHYIKDSQDLMGFYLPLLKEERQIAFMEEAESVERYVFENYENFTGLVDSLAEAKTGGKLAKKAARVKTQFKLKQDPEIKAWVPKGNEKDFAKLLKGLPTQLQMDPKIFADPAKELLNTEPREKIYHATIDHLPASFGNNKTLVDQALRLYYEIILGNPDRRVEALTKFLPKAFNHISAEYKRIHGTYPTDFNLDLICDKYMGWGNVQRWDK